MRAKLVIGLMVVVWLVGCKKEPPVTPEPPCYFDCNRDTLNILWVDTLKESGMFTSIPMRLMGDRIIHSYDPSFGASIIQSRHASTGEIDWEWFQTSKNILDAETQSFYFNNSLVLGSMNDHYKINLLDGSLEWSTSLINGNPNSYLFEYNYVFSKYYGSQRDSADIIVLNTLTQQIMSTIRIRGENGRGTYIRSLGGFENENGDRILIIGVNMNFPTGVDYSVDIYCYNISQDSLVWKASEIEQENGGALLNIAGYPKIDLEIGRIYIMTAKILFCLNIESGNVIWSTYFQNTNMLSSNYIIYENMVVWIDDMGHSVAVNKHTGDFIYRENLKDGAPGRIEAWGQKCIVARSELQLIDLNTGKVLRKAWIPKFGNERWFTSPLIDEANNRMYFTDGYAIICAEIPETWKE